MRNEYAANEALHATAIARAARQAQQAATARRVSLDVRRKEPSSRALQWLGVVLVALVMSAPAVLASMAH